MSPDRSEANSERRAVLRMSQRDFKRLKMLLVREERSWQSFLSEAVNLWLKEHGHKELDTQ
ncbi:MAG: hypothetical protein JSR64_09605 [Nitrospira sp.]|nr:hypothetical protein [Nitrospira sp.]MBS0194350.1 hypothetical protein [Pseudomonadota bacterium]